MAGINRPRVAEHNNDPAVNRRRVLHHLTTAYSFNQHQVAAVMAAIQHESTFRLGVVGDRNLGAGREAHGLFQWREDRAHAMRRFVGARPHQDTVTAQVDFAMHEMGIARRDNSNVPGPCFNKEAQAGGMLKRATTLRQAVDAMHQFERYDDRYGQTNQRHRTAMGFIREVADAIGRGLATVRDGVVNVYNKVFGSGTSATAPAAVPADTAPAAANVFRMHRVGDDSHPQRAPHPSYAPYGVPIRTSEQRPAAQVAPMQRPKTSGVLHPAPVFTMRRINDEPSTPRHSS